MNNAKNIDYLEILKQKKIQWLILLLFITFLYSKNIGYDNNLDDYIILDSLDGKINSVSDLWALFKLSYNNADYRPIVFLSFGIEHLIFNAFNPAVSHAVNCLLFFLVCISAIQLFTLLFEEEKNIIIFLSVLLFCVHPINTEVVSSIKCRDNLLSMLFGLIYAISFIKFCDTNKILFLIISFIFCLLSIFSKLDGFGLMIFILVYIYFTQENKKIFYTIVAIILAVVTINIRFYISEIIIVNINYKQLSPVVTFTENPLALDFTFTNRIIAGINTIWYYFTKLIYISPSKYYYGYNYYEILSVKSFSFVGGIVVLFGFISAFIYSIIKKNKVITVAIIGLFTTILYALNILQPVAGIIADRYIFIGSLFFCLILVYTLFYFLQYLKIQKQTYSILAVIIFAFSCVTFVRVNAWKNFRTIINTDAPKLYNSYEAMRIASSAYYDEYKLTEQASDLNQAIHYAEKGNAVYPKNILLHLLTGQFYFKKNEYRNAIPNFEIAYKNDTTLNESLIYLGDTYYALKNLDSSLYYYQKAVLYDIKNPELINNISTIYFERGEKEKCLQYNYNLIKKDSTTYAAYENLGYYYLAEKDTIKAKSYFKQGEKFGLKPVNINNL